MENWQQLLYPLGFLSAIPFTGRFLSQWLASEKAKQSVVTKSFWILSLFGNVMLLLHSFIQFQFTVAIIQYWNAQISWRNLALMKQNPAPLRKVVYRMIFGSALLTLLFFALSYWVYSGALVLMRSPSYFFHAAPITFGWHLIGNLGIALFTSRFWIQWYQAEKKQESHLSLQFWLLSLSGALLSALYFYQLGDPVNMIGPAVGIITYTRNIMLIKQPLPTGSSS